MWTLLSEFRISCDDDEERASRRVYRGCTRSPTCKGCTSCVCFGCEICRFSDCSCQTCVDFTMNAKTWVSKVTLLSWWFPLCVGSLPIIGAAFKRHPPHVWKKKASIVFVFFILNMNFQSLGLSVFAVLIDWFRTSNSVIYFLHLYFSYVWYLFFISIIEFIYHHFSPKELYC